MDFDHDERIFSELSEKDKKVVAKCSRQLSIHSVLSIRSDDILDDKESHDGSESTSDSITEEDALRLERVIHAFQDYKDTLMFGKDETDGQGKYRKLSSESFDVLLASTSDTRYVNPGRFYVSLTEESKNLVKEMNSLIRRRSKKIKTNDYTVVKQTVEELGSSYQKEEELFADGTNKEQFLTLESVSVDFKDENCSYNKYSILKPDDKSNGHASHNHDFSHANGHATCNNSSILSSLSAKARFRWIVRKVIREERNKKMESREKKRKDYIEMLFKRRANVTWFGLLLTLIGPFAFIADSATDLKVAGDHFAAGHPWWGAFTLMLVIFPTVLMNIVSYFFYHDDQLHAKRKPESGWKTVKIMHCFQLGLLERYWQIFIKAYKIKFKKINDVTQSQLYIAMNLDTAMLQMILAFTEDAPQLVLQLYVLIRRKLVERLISTRVQDIWTMISIFFSFISYSRALVNYISCLRDSKSDKGQLRWYGYIAMWFWRAFMFTSRILVLVFFATEYHRWFFLVLFLHFCVILSITWRHKINFFPEQKGMQVLIRITLSYIHTFCYFVLEGKKTIKWAVIYYTLIFLEALVLCTMWFTNDTQYVSIKFDIVVLFLVFISFGLGLATMVAYYKFLHPKFKRPQKRWSKRVPKEELCENIENEDEEDQENNAGDIEQGIHLPSKRAASIVQQVAVWV